VRSYWLEHRGSRHALREGENLVGRGDECNVFVHEPSVSRTHALVVRSGNDVTISDLGSSNGTFVNNKSLDEPRVLEIGDVVKIGNALLTFGATTVAPSSIPPGIELIEQQPERAQSGAGPTPQLGAIAALESLVAAGAPSGNPKELVSMIQSSTDRLVVALEQRRQKLAPDDAARLVAVAKAAARACGDGSLDGWVVALEQKLAG